MNIYTSESNKNEYEAIFEISLTQNIIIVEFVLRSETDYDKDQTAELTASHYIKNILSHVPCSHYLLTADFNVLPSSKLRMKLWNVKRISELVKLNPFTFECNIDSTHTRLGAIVNLEEYSYDYALNIVLSSICSSFIISKLNFHEICTITPNWLSKNEKSYFTIDFNSTLDDISKTDTAIMRYFFADNGSPEKIAIMCNKYFFRSTLEKSLKIAENSFINTAIIKT